MLFATLRALRPRWPPHAVKAATMGGAPPRLLELRTRGKPRAAQTAPLGRASFVAHVACDAFSETAKKERDREDECLKMGQNSRICI